MLKLRLCSLVLAASLAACGGGGGSGTGGEPSTPTDPTPTPPTPGVTFSSYQQRTLPGRLLMNAASGSQSVLLNLGDGSRQDLPHTAGATADSDEWSASADGAVLLRWNRDTNTGYPLQVFDSTNLQPIGASTVLPSGLGAHDLTMSQDRRYLLADIDSGFPDFTTQLLVLSASTLTTVDRGSWPDSTSVVGDPQAWLPDGRYVYLLGRQLYATAPGQSTSQLLATLDLPANDSTGTDVLVGQSELSVSPDGTRIAFTWAAPRAGNTATVDTHIYTARLDGSALTRITEVADATDPIAHSFGSPVWSPDGQWLAFALFVSGATSAPVWPDNPYGGAQIVGTTGCDVSPVYVVPASSGLERIGRSNLRTDLAVRVQGSSASQAQWVSTCARFKWIP